MKKLLKIFPKKKESQKIIIDYREKNSKVHLEISKLNIPYEFENLKVADYLIGEFAIERKSFQDLISSIINKRVLGQLKDLKKYPSPILLIEGFELNSILSNFNENALRGFLLSVILDYKIPIIFSESQEETAKYLAILSRKTSKKEHSLRASRTFLSEREQIQFILEGFPGVGPSTAKKLLNNFKNIKSISNASEEELRKVIGKKSEKIYNLFNSNFEPS